MNDGYKECFYLFGTTGIVYWILSMTGIWNELAGLIAIAAGYYAVGKA